MIKIIISCAFFSTLQNFGWIGGMGHGLPRLKNAFTLISYTLWGALFSSHLESRGPPKEGSPSEFYKEVSERYRHGGRAATRAKSHMHEEIPTVVCLRV